MTMKVAKNSINLSFNKNETPTQAKTLKKHPKFYVVTSLWADLINARCEFINKVIILIFEIDIQPTD